ncbi:MAG: hypothetical protein CVT47_04180 [Thermoplasmata archaeon HGW-Thermoplasmata-2]|nr:MAG: hypothetical protein CVT47_04180 [Thermoplasmata archaeon HGW-Thermoplasmata-2]
MPAKQARGRAHPLVRTSPERCTASLMGRERQSPVLPAGSTREDSTRIAVYCQKKAEIQQYI